LITYGYIFELESQGYIPLTIVILMYKIYNMILVHQYIIIFFQNLKSLLSNSKALNNEEVRQSQNHTTISWCILFL